MLLVLPPSTTLRSCRILRRNIGEGTGHVRAIALRGSLRLLLIITQLVRQGPCCLLVVTVGAIVPKVDEVQILEGLLAPHTALCIIKAEVRHWFIPLNLGVTPLSSRERSCR